MLNHDISRKIFQDFLRFFYKNGVFFLDKFKFIYYFFNTTENLIEKCQANRKDLQCPCAICHGRVEWISLKNNQHEVDCDLVTPKPSWASPLDGVGVPLYVRSRWRPEKSERIQNLLVRPVLDDHLWSGGTHGD